MRILSIQDTAAGHVLNGNIGPDQKHNTVRYNVFRNTVSNHSDSFGIIKNGEPMR